MHSADVLGTSATENPSIEIIYVKFSLEAGKWVCHGLYLAANASLQGG